jgi:hypothetical protein
MVLSDAKDCFPNLSVLKSSPDTFRAAINRSSFIRNCAASTAAPNELTGVASTLLDASAGSVFIVKLGDDRTIVLLEDATVDPSECGDGAGQVD